jgi:hypothetical protein
MREVSMPKRRAFVYFDNLGKRELTRAEMTNDLIGLESIESGPEAFRRFQEEQALALMRMHRESKARRGETHLETVSLWRLDADGNRLHYIKACGALTAPEAAQHVRYWDSKIAEDNEHRERYFKFHMKKHGRKLQRLLNLKDQPAESI